MEASETGRGYNETSLLAESHMKIRQYGIATLAMRGARVGFHAQSTKRESNQNRLR